MFSNPVTSSLASLRTNCVLSSVSSVAASTFVKPLPLPVNVLVPMLMLPNPLVISPAFSAPVPVTLLYVPVSLPFGTVPLLRLLALNCCMPAPLAVFSVPAYRSPATPSPPLIRTAPVVVVVAALVSLNVLIPAIVWLPPSLLPLTVPVLRLLASRLVNPLPLPVNVSVPMLMLPKPLVILPLFSAPVPVMLAWCCVTPVEAIRASGIVPVLKLVALSDVKPLPLPEKILVPMLMFPKPVLMLPAFSMPVPVILNWCCVTPVIAIRASGRVPLVR